MHTSMIKIVAAALRLTCIAGIIVIVRIPQKVISIAHSVVSFHSISMITAAVILIAVRWTTIIHIQMIVTTAVKWDTLTLIPTAS